MIGGKGQFTAYFQFLHILVPGPGSSGVEEKKFIAFRNMWSLNMTIHVCAHVDPEPYTKGWRFDLLCVYWFRANLFVSCKVLIKFCTW